MTTINFSSYTYAFRFHNCYYLYRYRYRTYSIDMCGSNFGSVKSEGSNRCIEIFQPVPLYFMNITYKLPSSGLEQNCIRSCSVYVISMWWMEELLCHNNNQKGFIWLNYGIANWAEQYSSITTGFLFTRSLLSVTVSVTIVQLFGKVFFRHSLYATSFAHKNHTENHWNYELSTWHTPIIEIRTMTGAFQGSILQSKPSNAV